MQIFIRLPSNKNIIAEIDQQMCCEDIKTMVWEREGMPEKNQMLTFGGKVLYNGMTLADMNVQHDDTVTCRFKITYDKNMRCEHCSLEDIMIDMLDNALSYVKFPIDLQPTPIYGFHLFN